MAVAAETGIAELDDRFEAGDITDITRRSGDLTVVYFFDLAESEHHSVDDVIDQPILMKGQIARRAYGRAVGMPPSPAREPIVRCSLVAIRLVSVVRPFLHGLGSVVLISF